MAGLWRRRIHELDLEAVSHLDEIRTVELMHLRENLLTTVLEQSHSMRV